MKDWVWYVEARQAPRGHANGVGSAVALRLAPRGGVAKLYLLTCSHVVRDGQVGSVLPDILCWPPGNSYTAPARLERVSGRCEHAHRARVVFPATPSATLGEAPDDWVLLELEDDVSARSTVQAWGVAGWGKPVSIVGYPAGAEGWSKDGPVENKESHGFVPRRRAEPGTLKLEGPDDTAPGMSGGGVFDDHGQLVGLHQSADGRALARRAVSIEPVLAALEGAGWTWAGAPRQPDLLPNLQAVLGTDPLVDGLRALLQEERRLACELDAAWPFPRVWLDESLGRLVRTGGLLGLDAHETAVGAGLLALASWLWKVAAKEGYLGEGAPDKRTVVAGEPGGERALEIVAGREETLSFLHAWSVQRRIAVARRAWGDDWIRQHAPKSGLGGQLADTSFALTALRAATGGEGLEALRDGRFEGAQVRWARVTAAVALAELQVLGGHLLTPDAIVHLVTLPAFETHLTRQLREVVLRVEGESPTWTLEATCEEPVLDHALTEMAATLDQEVRHRRRDPLWAVAQQAAPSVRAELTADLRDGHPRYERPHIQFSLASDHARRLLMSESLWSDPKFAFRELYQNALDACRYRRARSLARGIDYTPRIEMHHGVTEDGQEYVDCEDNGIGMDRRILEQCFAVAGRRFVDDEEYLREKEQWDGKGIEHTPNSRFGVGVFSYFLAADRLDVETARLSPSALDAPKRLDIRVQTAGAFFHVVQMTAEEIQRSRAERKAERGGSEGFRIGDAGTRVRLWLRKRLEEDFVEYLQHTVLYSETGLFVRRQPSGRTYELAPGTLSTVFLAAVEALPGRLWWAGKQIGGEVTRTVQLARSMARSHLSAGPVLIDGVRFGEFHVPGCIANITGSRLRELSISLDRNGLTDGKALTKSLRGLVQVGWRNVPPRGEALVDLLMWDPTLPSANAGENVEWLLRLLAFDLGPLRRGHEKSRVDKRALPSYLATLAGAQTATSVERPRGVEARPALSSTFVRAWADAISPPVVCAFGHDMFGWSPRSNVALTQWRSGCAEAEAVEAVRFVRDAVGEPVEIAAEVDAFPLCDDDWVLRKFISGRCIDGWPKDRASVSLGDIAAAAEVLSMSCIEAFEALQGLVGRLRCRSEVNAVALRRLSPSLAERDILARGALADFMGSSISDERFDALASLTSPSAGTQTRLKVLRLAAARGLRDADLLLGSPVRGDTLLGLLGEGRISAEELLRLVTSLAEIGFAEPLRCWEAVATLRARDWWSEAKSLIAPLSLDLHPFILLDRFSRLSRSARGGLPAGFLEELYRGLGREDPPVSEEVLRASVEISDCERAVLSLAPRGGSVRIVDLLMLAAEFSLGRVLEALPAVERFGVRGPAAAETYFGFTWEQLLKRD